VDEESGGMNATPQLVMVDTAIGDDIDDALALALVLRSPELNLQAVSTVFGDTWERARLASYLLQTFGQPDIPVAAGCSLPLQVRHPPSGVQQAALLAGHARDLQLSPLSGPELLIRMALAHPGRITLLCFGPLTNVAVALGLEPRLAKVLQGIFLMGGASQLFPPDWNVRSDARAARIVLEAGVPVPMIGWKVTWPCCLRKEDEQRLHHAPDEGCHLLSRLIAIWQQQLPRLRSRRPCLHDPLVVAALCAPQLFRFEHIRAHVLTHGPFAGFTVVRFMKGPKVWATMSVQREQARTWIMQRLLTESR
jgi:inosine-uridine nucleoside N-ribohydrolase